MYVHIFLAVSINLYLLAFHSHPEEALLSEKDEIFLTEIDEGHEPDVFWVALGGEDYYGSLLSGKDFLLRVWEMLFSNKTQLPLKRRCSSDLVFISMILYSKFLLIEFVVGK